MNSSFNCNTIKRKVSRGVFISKGKFLVCKAKDKMNYFLIGGGLEKNETGECAIEREVFEETGKKCNILHRLGVFKNYWTNEEGIFIKETIYSYKIYIFNCDANQILKSNENHIDFFWISLKNINKIDLRPKFLLNVIKEL